MSESPRVVVELVPHTILRSFAGVDAFFFPRRTRISIFAFLADCQTVHFENEKRYMYS
jgi:hypothetical protein